MRLRSMVWTGNFLAFAVLAFGVWHIIAWAPRIPDYRLFIGMVALIGIATNHFRWWKIANKIGDPNMAGRINHLIVINYLILLLTFALVGFPR